MLSFEGLTAITIERAWGMEARRRHFQKELKYYDELQIRLGL